MADLGFHEGGFISVEKNPRLRDKIWVGPGDEANSQYGQRSIARAIYGNDHPCLA